MNKLFTKIAALVLGMTMAVGVGVAVGTSSKASEVRADTESVTFSEQGYSNQQEIASYTGTNFSITFDKGTNSNAPKYFTTGSAIRCYGGNTFTVSSDATMSEIDLTFASGEGTNAITSNVGTYNSGVWTGSVTSVEFTVDGTSGHRRLASLTVTYNGTIQKWNVDFYDGDTKYTDLSTTVNDGSKVTRPTNPTKSGFTFVNWYTESELKNVFDFDTIIHKNYELYAKWDVYVGADYTITLSNSGVSGNSYSDGAERTSTINNVGFGNKGTMANSGRIQTQASNGLFYNTGAFPRAISKIVLTQEGTNRGFTVQGGSSTRLVNSTKGNYTISGGSTIGITNPSTAAIMTWTFADNVSYTFFALKINASNAAYIASIEIYLKSQPTVFHSITYKPGDHASGEDYSGGSVAHNSSYELVELSETGFVKEKGYTFSAWSVEIGDADAITKNPGDSVTITDDTVITALWEVAGKVQITYNAGEGSGAPASEMVDDGGEYTLNNGKSMTAPTGKYFSCWKDSDDIIYNGGDTITVEGSMTLTAQWASYPDDDTIVIDAEYLGLSSTYSTKEYFDNAPDGVYYDIDVSNSTNGQYKKLDDDNNIIMGKQGVALYNYTPFGKRLSSIKIQTTSGASESVIVACELSENTPLEDSIESSTNRTTPGKGANVSIYTQDMMSYNYRFFRMQIVSNYNAQFKLTLTFVEEQTPLESITLTNPDMVDNTLTIPVGLNKTIGVTYYPDTTSVNKNITWTSSDTSENPKISVDQNGKVTIAQNTTVGTTATITATPEDTHADPKSVTIVAGEAVSTNVTIKNGLSTTISFQTNQGLSSWPASAIVATKSDGSTETLAYNNPDITWYYNNSTTGGTDVEIDDVESFRFSTSNQRMKITYQGLTAERQRVEVTEYVAPVITIHTQTNDSYYVGEPIENFVTITDGDISGVTYTSTNPEVAVVEGGTLTVLSEGDTTITASYSGAETKTATIHAYNLIVSGAVDNANGNFYIEDSGTLVLKVPEGYNKFNGAVNDGVAAFVASGVGSTYDPTTKTVTCQFESLSTSAVQNLVVEFKFGIEGQMTEKVITKTLHIVNPLGLPDARLFATYMNAMCTETSKQDGWSTDVINSYAGLSKAAKDILKNAKYSVTGTGDQTVVTKDGSTHKEIAQAMAQYDYMVLTYGFDDIIGRNPSSGKAVVNPISIFGTAENSNMVAIVVIVSVVSLTAIGGYFFLKKRREQN